jgi:serine protease
MAAPQVTGAAAVVASVTGLRGSALRSRLLGPLMRPSGLGVGRLNVLSRGYGRITPVGQ